MNTFIYDGSYEGLLTAIFEAFSTKAKPVAFTTKENYQPMLMDCVTTITTDEEKANRVLKGLEAKSSVNAIDTVMKAFLSEQHEIEMVIYQYIKYLVTAKENVEEDFSNPYVLQLKQLRKQMGREIHRMHAFVRFQKTTDNIYFASIDPDFNVLPLIGEHFEKRYADQQWLIFDTKRNYGLFYDLEKTSFIQIDEIQINLRTGDLNKEAEGEKEKSYQSLWKNYFDSVNIRERKNIKFHLQKMPKRYWKYLPEKAVEKQLR